MVVAEGKVERLLLLLLFTAEKEEAEAEVGVCINGFCSWLLRGVEGNAGREDEAEGNPEKEEEAEQGEGGGYKGVGIRAKDPERDIPGEGRGLAGIEEGKAFVNTKF